MVIFFLKMSNSNFLTISSMLLNNKVPYPATVQACVDLVLVSSAFLHIYHAIKTKKKNPFSRKFR